MTKFESDQIWLAIRCEPNVSRTLSEELLAFANACEKIGMEKAAKIDKREVLLKAAASLYEFAVDNIHYPSRDVASMLIEKLRDIADE